LLNFSHSIRDDFGKAPEYVDCEFIEHENGPVFAIFVKKSPEPVYIKDVFYKRGRAETVELKAKELIDYVTERFKK